MTWETDLKNWRRGLPSSPDIEIAIPDKISRFHIFFFKFPSINLDKVHAPLIDWTQLPVTTEKMTRPRMFVESLQEPVIFQLSLGDVGIMIQLDQSWNKFFQ